MGHVSKLKPRLTCDSAITGAYVEQDVKAGGVGQAYVKGLASTSAIHEALQEAFICRKSVLAEEDPGRVLSDKLPDIPSASDDSLTEELLLSPDCRLYVASHLFVPCGQHCCTSSAAPAIERSDLPPCSI